MSLRRFFKRRDGARGSDDPLAAARERMIRHDLKGRGIRDERVLDAMARVPREKFVEERLREAAYKDNPLGIGFGQTISQPYIVARMSELLEIQPGEKVLEIGAGCGYQTAILMELGALVYAVEIVPELAAETDLRLRNLGYERFTVTCRDGREGWPEYAPYDAALLAAAAVELPSVILRQIREGGRIVAPIGSPEGEQMLRRWQLAREGWVSEDCLPVKFVPLVGSE